MAQSLPRDKYKKDQQKITTMAGIPKRRVCQKHNERQKEVVCKIPLCRMFTVSAYSCNEQVLDFCSCEMGPLLCLCLHILVPHHVVLVISVKERDAIGVKVDGVPLLQPLLEAGDPPDGHHQVGREDHQHDRLHPLQ